VRKKDNIVLVYSHQESDLSFEKKISISKGSSFSIEYNFEEYNALKNYDFAVEFNLFLQSPKDILFTASGNNYHLRDQLILKKITSLSIHDHFKNINIKLESDEADILIMPIYSVSSSESGFEKVYQQISVMIIKKTDRNLFSLACLLKKED
jgi:hypothetical protein